MEFTYKLESIDFLKYQLFTASKSKQIAKKKMYGWLVFTLAAALFALYCYFNNSTALGVYFGVIAAVWGLFYPKYFSWKYYKHYKSFVTKNYESRFGKTTRVTFSKTHIIATDDSGEGKIKLTEIANVNETSQHLFISFLSGASLIIPKNELVNLNELKEHLTKIGCSINRELDWRWK